jgi:thiol:disulfide interchange protein DsbA
MKLMQLPALLPACTDQGVFTLKKLLLCLGLVLLAPMAVQAQEYQAGTHYDVLSPALRGRSADKIEVLEFFAYSCGHCYNFEPLIQKWKQGLAADVDFQPSPAVWNAAMEPHAKAFYTAQALGDLDKMHGALFAAMHVDKKRLSSEAEIRQIFVANGVTAADFDKAFGSFGIGSQIRQAVARQKGARITGTPEMLVAGKYQITTGKAGSQANMLKVADFLIAKERALMSAAAAN